MAVPWKIGESATTGRGRRGRRANRSKRIKLEPQPGLDLVVSKGLLAWGHPFRAGASRVNASVPKVLPPCPQLYSSSMSPPLLRPNTQIQEGGAQLLRPSQNPDSLPSLQLTGVRGGSAGGWDAWVLALAPACRGLTSGFGYGEEKGRRL